MDSIFRSLASWFQGIIARLPQSWAHALAPLTTGAPNNAPSSFTVNGRKYLVQKQLGSGGFAYVFLVYNQHGQKFALKRIRAQLPEHEERLQHEIAIHNKLGKSGENPYIVKIFDAEVVRNPRKRSTEGYLLLEYHENGSLQDIIDKYETTKFMELELILQLLVDICKGLLSLHTQSPPLAFRDLKPGNILLSRDSRAILTDLGSVAEARCHIQSRQQSLALSEECAETVTAPYRPPELHDPPIDKTIDEKTDVWSLGCVAYALGYKVPPFDGSLTAAIGGSFRFPKDYGKPDPYPDDFKALIKRLVQPDASKRPSVEMTLEWLEEMKRDYKGKDHVAVSIH